MAKKNTALIFGISGQDGSYLARFLLNRGYEVFGTSRYSDSKFDNLQILGIRDQVKIVDMTPTDPNSVASAIEISNPGEVYYLAGQSSVGRSFEEPVETIHSIVTGTLNVLEACSSYDKNIRIYHAGSSEAFGDVRHSPADECTPFRPKSPYGVAKASACLLVDNYREAYDLFACSGILFNHESPLRPPQFVTKKIISSVNRIAEGSQRFLTLGRIDIVRDWGWAPEYVEAMWLMLQQKSPENFVIATGKSYSLKDFVSVAFQKRGLEWKDHVKLSDQFRRPTDLVLSTANPSKSHEILGWRAELSFNMIVEKLLSNEVY